MSLNPATFELALAKARSRPSKPRKPLRQGKALSRGSKRLTAKPERKRKAVKKVARVKVRTWKRLIKDLDSLTSQIVRLRDGRCVLFRINETCTGSDRLQCGHIFGRRSHGARWDTELDGNCHAQCANCNSKHNAHQWVYYRWYIEKFGQEAFDELYRRWAKGRKYTRLELQNLLPEFEAKLAELQKGSPNDQDDNHQVS